MPHVAFSLRWIPALAAATLLAACGGADERGNPAPSAVGDRRHALAVDATAAAGTWAFVADEYQTFTLAASALVRYGRDTRWVEKTLSGSVLCGNRTFGDPAFGERKHCEVWKPAATTGWVKIADEYQTFTLATATPVRYGRDTRWIEKTLSGSVLCGNKTFGDPAVGERKECQVPGSAPPPPPPPGPAMTQLDARRMADQATFGANEPLLAQMRTQSAAAWVKAQMALSNARYTSGKGDDIDRNVQEVFFCNRAPYSADPNCWRDWFSTEPLLWDFYRNAVTQPDQLRQRVAFALAQIVVISGVEVEGTYGLREYHNMLLAGAFGDWRTLLKKVTLSPMMGEYLDHVNNDRAAPNENFARELLQLFALGTCELNADGSLKGGRCTPTYDNEIVRNYAYALTGWTYPAGGSTVWGCWPKGTNCTYRKGDMVAATALLDNQERRLLSGVVVPASRTPAQALERVLDSLMNHPNMAPFVGRQLIQHLVTSNPSPAYVQRVAQAFGSGRFTDAATGTAFGTGARGDLAATVAAVLLDAEARNPRPGADAGKLREPVLTMTGILRALNGRTDGASLGWWWGEVFRQHAFRSPSVFNFYPPDFPLPGTNLVAPAFGIHNANAALDRLNFLTYLLDWNGSNPDASVPGAIGTKVDLGTFVADAGDAGKLVDRVALLALGEPLPAAARNAVVSAVQAWTAQTDPANWQQRRVRTAAYLIFGSPLWQVQR
jgi:uncharacterized protein (DUF1800 family)